jgi:primosomal protein N' (replication factor Y)
MIGFGTEKLEQTLTELFPEAQVIRFDRDVLTTPHQIQDRLLSLQDQGGIILVGTQLISKGYHMPKMSLAIILLAENMFCFPDFRALERGIQLIAQIAGRTGRGDTQGEVLIQTFMEGDELKGFLGEEHYPSFMGKELKDRQTFKLPPYWRLALIRVEGLKWAAVERAAISLRALIKEAAKAFPKRLFVLPATPAPIEQKKAKFEYHILIKAKDGLLLHQILLGLNHRFGLNGGIRISVDIDPVDML